MAAEIELLLQQASALNLCEVVEAEEKASADTSIQVIGGKVVVDRRKKRKKKFSEQYLKYLIVIDFEATCWRERRVSPNEIIGELDWLSSDHIINPPSFQNSPLSCIIWRPGKSKMNSILTSVPRRGLS